jgi:DNA-binding CsgD family transcriptional regulator
VDNNFPEPGTPDQGMEPKVATRVKTKSPGSATQIKRKMLAEFLRNVGDEKSAAHHDSPVQGEPALPAMSPRLRQTLDLLLAGDGEKQIAGKLGLSRHTVHDYVKGVYRQFGVCSRAELLAKWVRK